MQNAFDVGDQARAELADLIDQQMRPLGEVVLARLAPAEGQTVLDVGCGAGETSVQLAARVGSSGRVIGIDIAPRVLAVAKRRASSLPQITLMQDDAGGVPLPDKYFDMVFSRFGTMFFPDPVAAFANMHRMLKLGGKIGFVCWRSVEENELDSFCIEAAGLPITVDASPYSFEKGTAVQHVLTASGFKNISVEPHDMPISAGDVDATLMVVTRVGALGKVLRENPDLLTEAEPLLRSALSSRERNGMVHLGSATWIVVAKA